MKIEELRVGNMLNYDTAEGDVVVTKVDWQDLKWLTDDPKGFNSVYTPIPITADWLERLGLKLTYEGNYYKKYDHPVNLYFGYDIFKKRPERVARYYGNYIKIEYVHQLQNLYFALTGEELSVNLTD